MRTAAKTITLAGALALIVAGCAVSPEAEERRAAIEADIEEILSLSLNVEELGEPERCLSDVQYRSFRALGERHILFEGSRDRLWVNSLRSRCVDLRHGDVLVTRQFQSRRLCKDDQFAVAEYFDLPYYRRWPWNWGRWPTGPVCFLGEFQPVSQEQVDEIEARLEDR